jgi:hypothetical protein
MLQMNLKQLHHLLKPPNRNLLNQHCHPLAPRLTLNHRAPGAQPAQQPQPERQLRPKELHVEADWTRS